MTTAEIFGIDEEALEQLGDVVPIEESERLDADTVNVTVLDKDYDDMADWLEECGYQYRMV